MEKLTRGAPATQCRDPTSRPASNGRIVCLVKWLGALALLLLAVRPPDALAEGRYERRRAARGETTATSAKLGVHAFIDDRDPPPQRLTMFVDAGGLRDWLVPELVPLRVGVAYRGKGVALPLTPSAFRLDAEELEAALVALNQEQVLAHPRGRLALAHAARALAVRHAPSPFGTTDGLRIPTRFHADPSVSVAVHDETRLPPGAWFIDVLFFELPEGFDPWGPLLTLSLVTRPSEPGGALEEHASVRFRVEEDAQLHRLAFRRARKARRQEDKAAARAEKAARASAEGAPPPR